MLFPFSPARPTVLSYLLLAMGSTACGGIAELGAPDDYSSDLDGGYARDVVEPEVNPGVIVSDDTTEPGQPGTEPGAGPGPGGMPGACNCPAADYQVYIVDYSTGEVAFYDQGPGRAVLAAPQCGVVDVPVALELGCGTTYLAACSKAGECVQLQTGDGQTQMNLWAADGNAVTVFKGSKMVGDTQADGGYLFGGLSLLGDDGAPLYDIKFSACALPAPSAPGCK